MSTVVACQDSPDEFTGGQACGLSQRRQPGLFRLTDDDGEPDGIVDLPFLTLDFWRVGNGSAAFFGWVVHCCSGWRARVIDAPKNDKVTVNPLNMITPSVAWFGWVRVWFIQNLQQCLA